MEVVPAAYRRAIPTVKKACYTHQAMTTLTPTVVRLAMDLPCKVISGRHVLAAMVRSGERMALVVVVAVVPAAYQPAILTAKKACYTHRAMTPPIPMVVRLATGLPYKEV